MKSNHIVTAIQPTGNGIPHIGNYLGMTRQLSALCDQAKYAGVFVADIHATTALNYDPAMLRKATATTLRSLIACGIPEKYLFVQSDFSGHFQTGLVLQHLSKLGRLERMSQFQVKTRREGDGDQKASIPLGLLTYPCLMSADIILHGATDGHTIVPCGPDQGQHLVFTNEVVKMLNKMAKKQDFKSQFTPLFAPVVGHTSGLKIGSLTAPDDKMSKSTPDGAVFLTDDRKTYTRKYRSAVTGMAASVSGTFLENETGTRNLLTILAGFTDITPEQASLQMSGRNFSALKDAVIQAHSNVCGPIARRMNDIYDEDIIALRRTTTTSGLFRETMVASRTRDISYLAGLGG